MPRRHDDNYGVDFCGLADLRYKGEFLFSRGGNYKSEFLTWSNWASSDVSRYSQRLTRALVNDQWLLEFPSSEAKFTLLGISDHSACIDRMQPSVARGPKPFRFFNYWADEPPFCWWLRRLGSPQSLPTLPVVITKLKAVKHRLKAWSRAYFGRTSDKLKEKRDEISLVQADLSNHLDNQDMQIRERGLLHQYRLLSTRKETSAKARIRWLKEGIGNTRLFTIWSTLGEAEITYLLLSTSKLRSLTTSPASKKRLFLTSLAYLAHPPNTSASHNFPIHREVSPD
ncbi:uncharacterized protein LOC122654878 [Telopea speciosissima]|uniref:uncharacterized protein LOC122654878 n=1 Tax=Telopea speciosissima TaxID=54955 RepID=UPI001CC35D38|nr:uncharacterized protein LOC122654878 [Telopea speciosissima]